MNVIAVEVLVGLFGLIAGAGPAIYVLLQEHRQRGTNTAEVVEPELVGSAS